MSEKVSLSPEEKELLSSVVRRRHPSMLWTVASDKPMSPAQRDTLKSLLTDEMREAGGATTERGALLKKLIERIAHV
jgi:hypothetical protein